MPEHGSTWRELAIRDLRLVHLKRRIEMVRDGGSAPDFCANDYWYGRDGQAGFRDDVARLVGPQARPDDPILGTSAALHAASAFLRGLLPPCRGCDCANLTGRSAANAHASN